MKYPRTYHLPWSEGISNDDRIVDSLNSFKDKDIIIWEKMDGENTTMSRDTIFARSIDSKDHESRHWVKKYWNDNIRFNIPERYRICGENLFAKHSIFYNELKSYFYGFAMYDENNICLSFDDTIEFFNSLNIQHPEIFFEGSFKNFSHDDIMKKIFNMNREIEGYVMRNRDSFSYDEHHNNVVKYVRKNHVNTDKHWLYQKIEKNKLLE